jgi:hypothetical protein
MHEDIPAGHFRRELRQIFHVSEHPAGDPCDWMRSHFVPFRSGLVALSTREKRPDSQHRRLRRSRQRPWQG